MKGLHLEPQLGSERHGGGRHEQSQPVRAVEPGCFIYKEACDRVSSDSHSMPSYDDISWDNWTRLGGLCAGSYRRGLQKPAEGQKCDIP